MKKGMGVALASGALALTLVAAQAPAVPAVGTASTSLTAVELAITGIGDLPALTVLDAGTFASTDTDAAHNVRGNGSPFAAVDLVPLLTGDTAHGAVSVTAAQGESNSATAADQAAVNDLLGAVVNPIKVDAAATADSATATISAATAQINALAAALGISVDTAGVVSQVTTQGASATQGIKVSEVGLDLGDLVPVDVLAALPIDVLLDLLSQLPVGVPDVQAIVDEILAVVGSVEGVTADLEEAGAQLDATVDALVVAVQDLASAEALVATLEGDLVDAQAAEAAAQTAVDAAAAELAELQAIDPTDLATFVGTSAEDCLSTLDPVACLDDKIAAAEATLAAAETELAEATATVDEIAAALAAAVAALGPLVDAVDALTDLVDALVTLVVDLVNQLIDILTDLLAALTNLTGSLDEIVKALADGELVSVGALDLGINAAAAGSEETSSATVLCAPVAVSVAGQSLGTPDCSNPLTAASEALNGALAAIEGVLSSLPVAADVVPDVSFEVFPTVAESVTTDGAYVTATAQVVALDLDIPSVTIDPANLVDGLLSNLSLDLVDQLLATLPVGSTLDDLGLGEIGAALDGARAELDTTVAALQVQLGEVLALLPDGSQLPTITTPGIALTVDPTSTASFRAGSAATGAPDPSDPGTSLPTTGGGAIVLAGLALLGAGALGRRRK